MCTTVALQWNIHVLCGSHACSAISVKYVYSAPCHMVHCGTSYVIHICEDILYVNLSNIYIYGIYAQFGGHICF